VTSKHPLFTCITKLYSGIGNSIKKTDSDKAAQVLETTNVGGVFAIYDGALK